MTRTISPPPRHLGARPPPSVGSLLPARRRTHTADHHPRRRRQIFDDNGRSYLDGLSGLFVVQAGHGRVELAEAAAKQAKKLAFFPLWSYATPPAIELAERLANYAPGDLNRVFFTTGGGEAVESAWKLAKQYFKLTGKPGKHKVISRSIAYHGTPQGALAITGIPALKAPFEPLTPGGFRVPNTNFYRAGELRHDPKEFGRLRRPHRRGHRVRGTGHRRRGLPRTRAECRRLLPATARLLRAGPRDLRRVRRAAGLRRGDLRLRPDRFDVRLQRLRLRTRHHHLRQGHDLGLLPDRRDDRDRPAVRALQRRQHIVRPRLHVWRTPGFGGRRAGQPRHLRARRPQRPRQGARAGVPADARELYDLPIVGDVRGEGYFYGIELVKDKATKETFNDEESERLLRGFLTPALFEAGLYCRADDRGDPVVQLAPPLISGQAEFDAIYDILHSVLGEASRLL